MAGYAETAAYWQSFPIQTVSDLEQRLENFRVLFAYHSGKIENEEITLHDTREIFENGKVLNYTGSPRAIFEQQNQKLCYEFLKEKIAAKEPLTQELVLEVHRILTSGTYDERRFLENGERPGEYKKHDYITGKNEVGAPADRVAEILVHMAVYLISCCNLCLQFFPFQFFISELWLIDRVEPKPGHLAGIIPVGAAGLQINAVLLRDGAQPPRHLVHLPV